MPLQIPETRYAKSGEVNIAYQVLGDGPDRPRVVAGIHLERRTRSGTIRASRRDSAIGCRVLLA